MGLFERDGRTTVQHMIGGWAGSRATNPSSGDDPVSLGMLPGILNLPQSPSYNDNPPVGQAPPGMLGAPGLLESEAMAGSLPAFVAPEVPSGPPGPQLILIDLNQNVALLNSRTIQLDFDAHEIIMKVLIDSYEKMLRDELTSLRMEHLCSSQGEGTPPVPEQARPAATQHLQSMPQKPRRKRKMPNVLRIQKGAGTPAPTA